MHPSYDRVTSYREYHPHHAGERLREDDERLRPEPECDVVGPALALEPPLARRREYGQQNEHGEQEGAEEAGHAAEQEVGRTVEVRLGRKA